MRIERYVGIEAPENEQVYPVRDIPADVLAAMSEELNFFGDIVDIGMLSKDWEGHPPGSFVMMEGEKRYDPPIIVLELEEDATKKEVKAHD